ncbi:peptide MFS transporter [Leptospira sp. GIMC2001]|uniref:peptide MFS transporter n=1 Tax=Leptospira sp. GIMC2001 TaxID=1513297 RepID=UPI00234B33AD|nr:peptide MFS transporter [Leptospira sp. GIMC2001]WCL48131.1 peptide MFS transporter [Leptospira sp. GIMC2001]
MDQSNNLPLKPNETLSSTTRVGHPKALPVLFLTEMWERFSYYGMRALLVLYAVKFLHFTDREAGQLYGAYTGLVYLTPIFGGWIADRYLGFRHSIIIGAILMGIGHLLLACDGLGFFFAGLSFLIIGNGFFKPNMSSLVGRLYEDRTNLKDSGYTIFYMGINLGGFFGPILCGYLGEAIGWHYGFGAAGIGMGVGLLIFLLGQKLIPDSMGRRPLANNLFQTKIISNQLTQVEISRIKVILVLTFFSIFFWSAFEQAGSSMNLFADRFVDRTVLNFTIPASVFQSVNPVFILLLAPLFAKLWTVLGKKSLEPDSAFKFSIGLFLLSFGFVCLVLGAREYNQYGIASLHWLILAYLFNTLGELCLSPVGLSMVSSMSPPRLGGLLMGMWFLSNAIAHYAGGVFSGIANEIGMDTFFGVFVVLAMIAGIILLVLRPKLSQWSEKS